MPSQTKAIKQAARLIEAVRVVWPECGLAVVSGRVQQAMLRHVGLDEATDRVAAPMYLLPVGKRLRLYLGEEVAKTDALSTVVRMKAFAFEWGSERPLHALTASLFAVAVALPHQVRAEEREKAKVLRALRSHPELLVTRGLSADDVLAAAELLFNRIDPPVLPENSEDLQRWALGLYEDGRHARQRGSLTVARTAFSEAIRLARKAQNFDILARATIGLGKTARQAGNYKAARRLFRRAHRITREHELRELGATALHEILLTAIELGDFHIARRLEHRAIAAHGPSHERLPWLAHDIAHSWLLQGEFLRALPLFEEALRHFTDQTEQMVAWGNIARAAGALGMGDLWERADRELTRLFGESATGECVAQCRLGAAYGAAGLGLWDRAIEGARDSLKLALQRREGRWSVEAEVALDSFQRRRGGLSRRQPAALSTADRRDALSSVILEALRSRPAAEGCESAGKV